MTTTHWTRIEVTSRSTGFSDGLEARVADPLWMLSRQWQVGELQGDDAAQPAAVRATIRSVGVGPPATAGPLEPHVESSAQPDRGGAAVFDAAVATARLLAMLRRAGPDAAAAGGLVRAAFASSAPSGVVAIAPAGTAAAAVLAARSIDPDRLVDATAAELDSALAPLDATARAAAAAIVERWRTWYRGRPGAADAGHWDDERLEYTFDLGLASAAGGTAPPLLRAPAHDGGDLDWHAFDLVGQPAPPARSPVPTPVPNPPGPITPGPITPGPITPGPAGPQRPGSIGIVRAVAAIPTPVRYQGMPASRWWEMEDGRVNFGAIDAGPADIARLVVAEFATSYSNDWFMLPVRVPVGSLTEVRAVRVVDNFGGTPTVRSAAAIDGPARPWRLFELSGDVVDQDHPSPWLFVPPTVVGDLSGAPVERVALARDEGANLVWGIEQLVEGATGRPVSRAQAWESTHPGAAVPAGSTSSAPTPPLDSAWRYRLEAPAPPWWIPFLPELIDRTSAQIRLRRARMHAWDDLSGDQLGPQSDLLDPSRPRWLLEEEVPACGVRIERRWRMARWHDGSVHSWMERRKTPGRGERSSGLRWDLLQ